MGSPIKGDMGICVSSWNNWSDISANLSESHITMKSSMKGSFKTICFLCPFIPTVFYNEIFLWSHGTQPSSFWTIFANFSLYHQNTPIFLKGNLHVSFPSGSSLNMKHLHSPCHLPIPLLPLLLPRKGPGASPHLLKNSDGLHFLPVLIEQPCLCQVISRIFDAALWIKKKTL